MAVPYTFGTATAAIPLSQLDSNFATAITIGNTAVQLGNTVTTLNNMTLANVTISSGNVTITNVAVTTANVTTANIATSIITSGETLSYGTANSVQYLSTSKVVTSDANFVYTTTGLGIGTNSPSTKLDVAGNANIQNGVLTIGKDTVYDAFVNTPESMYFNVDSDGNSTGNKFVWGTDRTGTSGGTTWMTLDSSGNLGLGVTPSAWNATSKAFQIGVTGAIRGRSDANLVNLINNFYNDTGGTNRYINSDFATNYQQISGQHQWYTAASGTAGASVSFTQAMTLDASGQLGIGVTPMSYPLDVKLANNQFVLARESTNNITNGFRIGGPNNENKAVFSANSSTGEVNLGAINTNYFLTFSTNGANERARIDSSGNLLVGKTSASAFTTVGTEINATGFVAITRSGSLSLLLNRETDNGEVAQFRRSNTTVGSIDVTTTATSYVTSSDYRLKNTVAPMTGALAKVALLKPVTYKWNADGSDGEGFIAHELAEVCPHAVTGIKDAVNEDGSIKPQGIDTSFLVATLTAAIQELKAEFDAYKATHP